MSKTLKLKVKFTFSEDITGEDKASAVENTILALQRQVNNGEGITDKESDPFTTSITVRNKVLSQTWNVCRDEITTN